MRQSMIMAMACTMLLFTSCMEISVNGGLGKKIKASKTMVTRAMTPDAFDKLNVSAVANVKFVQSAEEECRVVMTAPDNYVELFKIESKNGLLDIDYTKPNINIENKKVSITVYAPQLSQISNTGVAQIETDSLVAPNLNVDNSGVGNIQLRGLNVKAVEVECSGVGNISLKGKADVVKMECSGVGSIQGADLRARSVEADVSGVGGIDCFASEAISGEVSGVGSLKYGGHPQSKQLNRSGIGSLKEI